MSKSAIDELRAKEYMTTLLATIAPQCEPLPDCLGLATQLDNFIAGQSERLADAEAALAECEREKAKLRQDIEQGFMEGAYARLQNLQEAERKLAECERQARLDKDDLDRFLKIITDLGLEFAPSERVQWRNRKAIDLERKLAAAREGISKAITIIEPYCSDGDDQTMLEAALEWLRAALTEAGEGEK